jgi:hypothetical protein
MAADRARSSTSSDSISLHTIRGRAPQSPAPGMTGSSSPSSQREPHQPRRGKGKARVSGDRDDDDEIDLLDDDARAEHVSLLIEENGVRSSLFLSAQMAKILILSAATAAKVEQGRECSRQVQDNTIQSSRSINKPTIIVYRLF